MPIKVYLIEDHQMLSDGIKLLMSREAQLQFAGEAGNCADATLDLGKIRADVILMDFKLPDGDSLMLIPLIKREHPQAKLLVMSGTTSRILVRSCLLAGAHGFIAKDDGGQEIIRGIKAVLAGHTFLSTQAVSAMAKDLCSVDSSPAAGLSDQEIAVLRGIASGMTYKEIARQLGISGKSVETYRTRLVRKTGLKSKVALTKFAAANAIIAI